MHQSPEVEPIGRKIQDKLAMGQSSVVLGNTTKLGRKREFLDAMELVAPWAELVAVVERYEPDRAQSKQLFAVQTLLRVHIMQQWFKYSDPAMEDASHDVPAFGDFAGLSHLAEHIPCGSSTLGFRHLLERRKLAKQIMATVNALLQTTGLQLEVGTVVDAA